MPRLALFDLDNTLVDRRAAFVVSVSGMCEAAGYGPEIEAWMVHELADRAGLQDFARLREAFALEEPAAQLWQTYMDRMAAAVTCRPAVLEGLAQLRSEGWTIGVATNGAPDIQRAKLTAAGISALVHGVAVSGDIEARKPDIRLFELTAARCGTSLSEGGWMTGDQPVGDIEGGRQAGLSTIWLRRQQWPDDLAPPDHTVDDVSDAITFLLTETE
ncbi:HAD family hydrolase [Streptomyces syringium]|uniref:HAD family hydrolase n=1 Tax=Streptomyces syringium TaxID=76729 RepID=UPI0033A35EDE